MGISNISQGLPGSHSLAGTPLPASQSAYLRAVQSRSSRHAWIGFRPVRQEHAPRGLEVGAGLVEGGGGTALVLARMRARIEAAPPFPRIGVVRVPVRITIVPTGTSPK
jgi:hypothetical protein